MRKTKKITAFVSALAVMLSSAASCSKNVGNVNENTSVTTAETNTEAAETEAETTVNPEDYTITWLADYDLNPSGNSERSVALSIFEDFYGYKINYVYASSEEKLSVLDSMINSGEKVDMFPYESNALPNGVVKGRFEPLDPYFDTLEMDNEELWGDMQGIIDRLEYSGQHYVVPYCVDSPFLITYSRTLMKSLGFDDPYELYRSGEWNWDVFMKMMNDFKASTPSAYGVNGSFGQALLQSTGHSVVNYENGVFTNNINDPEIEKAELLMQDIANKGLYRSEWVGYYPTGNTTLFFAMGDWSLGTSNAKNPDADLMVVPFPKSPDADKYYLSCNYGAKMLVKNSDKGEAVASYIKCERIARTKSEYLEESKQKALIPDKTATGTVRSIITEEQYDAIQEFLSSDNTTPAFDFGCGMGERMLGNGDYTYETRGVIDNLSSAFLEKTAPVESWDELREQWTGVIDEVIREYNG